MEENQVSKTNLKKIDWANAFPKFIVGLFLFLLGLWVGRSVSLPFLPGENQPKINILNKLYSKDNVDFATFWQTWDLLNSTYLNKKDLNGQKLLDGAIFGLVQAAGDPYTAYFDKESNSNFNEQISGQLEGVGLEIGIKDSKLVVIAPLDGSPGAKAGILAGDQIVAINGKDASNYTIGEAVKIIRGKAGTKVTLLIIRSGHADPIKFELTREKITVNTVRLHYEGDAAWISISRFGEETNKEWDKAVNDIVTKGTKKIVIDLRNNPGGLLTSAIYTSNEFLPKGQMVVQEEDSDGKRFPYLTDREGRLQEVKTIVLINKGSASASEILSGALQDLDKATIAGETSFGKGTVQKPTSFSDGSGVHITFAKWLTPKGNWIHGKGITPNIVVALTEDDFKKGKDPQKDKALDLLK